MTIIRDKTKKMFIVLNIGKRFSMKGVFPCRQKGVKLKYLRAKGAASERVVVKSWRNWICLYAYLISINKCLPLPFVYLCVSKAGEKKRHLNSQLISSVSVFLKDPCQFLLVVSCQLVVDICTYWAI